jgi:hypothetical protein
LRVRWVPAMTDSNRTSASAVFIDSAEHGTPVGHPTPTGEPDQLDQPYLFPDAAPLPSLPPSDSQLLEAIGRLVLNWGQLERVTAEKVASMRESFGDVRAVGGRTRPTMQKLLAELRALVAMRDRHDKQALAVIAEVDGALQRTAQVRQLIIDGAQGTRGRVLDCRDMKNASIEIGMREIEREAMQLSRIGAQITRL